MSNMPEQPQETPYLLERLKDRSARVGVVGIGYVGLPSMVAIAEAGFRVTGIDSDESRVALINAGESYIEDVDKALLANLVHAEKISATTSYQAIRDLDVVLVCVPTPITKHKEPDLEPLKAAITGMAANMRREQLLVLQSTTYPGTTQEFVLPMLEKTGLKVGKDFYLAFALERIDPGNPGHMVGNVPKVVSGVTSECTRIVTAFFSYFVDRVVPVSSPKVAEMTKLLENTFRNVNIALVNELSMLCHRMDVDVWEVIDAASTKPFGFMPFYPGPGVGGHCIPVDPFYLSWKAKEHDFYVNFIELAANINSNMPYYTVSRIAEILGDYEKSLNGSRILILGVTFKENIADMRNSPAIRVMELLSERGTVLSYTDPRIPSIRINGSSLPSLELDPVMIGNFDAVVILVRHDEFDWAQIVDNAKLVIDTRNAVGLLGTQPNVTKI